MTSNLERSAALYGHAAEVISDFGKMFDLPIDKSLTQAWNKTMVTIRHIDHFIDNEADFVRRKQFGDTAISFLQDESTGFNWEDNHLVNNSVNDLKRELALVPPENKSEFIDILSALQQAVEQTRHSKRSEEYSQRTAFEGELMSRLLLTLVPKEKREEKNYKKFAGYLIAVGRFSNLIDSVIDFSRDYKGGQTELQPTLENKWQLATHSLPDFLTIIAQTSPAVALSLLGSTKAVYQSFSTR